MVPSVVEKEDEITGLRISNVNMDYGGQEQAMGLDTF